MKVLIIEDEIELQRSIQDFLEREHFLVESANTYEAGLDKVLNHSYDIVLLDIMLPGGNGLDLLKLLKRENKPHSVLILSAKDSVDDKVMGLEIGADDYLAKPFHFAELLARIKSIVRRNSQHGDSVIRYHNVSLDVDNRTAFVEDQELQLNRKEFDVLYYFLLRPNKLLEKTTLAETVWGDHADQADNLDFIYSQIKNLRKKLKDAGANLDIQAVYGVGYKLV
ncbi:DNA-binding response regulator, OmpR family, contains REC and winged-helix (wHTH) domain [Sphingobacterium nematocida]|uniref:DNA-binding response regulator, OmpR family, contains REC and winged-helix (WHTH) domain n=1 Tax=Sphingobacterium nematocida TaxID=1513896 RepID=A0A1T5FS93_9SPHI|nr:response regulator transcription factor [Sphingobacterium nematocida]SKB99002.1 DNA-binding response regulator, OmpR family, contains REC and winged-helix (wHTH) domain [Sphingobacterium nematocida]